MGALLAIPVVLSARIRIGNLPKLNYKDLIKPAGIGMAGMFTTSFLAGLAGYVVAKDTDSSVLKIRYSKVAYDVPKDAMKGWVIDAYAHRSAYASGTLVGLGLACYTLWKRYLLKTV